jgi:uncharacterized membrane protein (UPF0127 family)
LRSAGDHRFVVGLLVLSMLATACDTGMDDDGAERNDLGSMETARLTIGDQEFEVWLARTTSQRTLGLKRVTADELAPTRDGAIRGMFFLFAEERVLRFTMRDTIVDLDIAFLRADGEIVTIHTMEALSSATWSSGVPAQYALEVLAGTFQGLGIVEGDQAVLPDGIP